MEVSQTRNLRHLSYLRSNSKLREPGNNLQSPHGPQQTPRAQMGLALAGFGAWAGHFGLAQPRHACCLHRCMGCLFLNSADLFQRQVHHRGNDAKGNANPPHNHVASGGIK